MADKPPDIPTEIQKLTPKRAEFVRQYLIDLNATQAATRAGYSAKTANEQGSHLLTIVSVKAAIDAALAERSKRTGITADYVLETIRDTVERCRQAHPVLDKEGAHVLISTPGGELKPAYTFEPAQVLKGCELLGKHLKLFADVGSKENPLEVIHKVERTIVAARPVE